MELLFETDLPNLFYRGKVRDTYDLGDSLLLIATDRISAFDLVLPCGIPDKGMVLNQLSAFWFEKTAHLIPKEGGAHRHRVRSTGVHLRLSVGRIPGKGHHIRHSFP
jgi:phosphoribosylaminoimidazole-succinocarboxamide synthase